MKTGKDLVAEINDCRLQKGQCAFWWLGQHSFIVKMGNSVCYLDPFLSDHPDRQIKPLLKPEEVTNATVVLGSHDHLDHIDRAVWPAIAAVSPDAVFVTPKLLSSKIAKEVGLPAKRVLGVDTGISVNPADVKITGVPAAHELLDPDPGTGLNPCIGFLVEANGIALYHSGDCCIYEGMQAILRRWKLDLAFLPINGRDAKRYACGCIGNMTYQEAADLAGAIKPGLTVPAHFEMFAMNSQDPRDFADYMRVKYPRLKVHVPKHGQLILVKAV